MSFARLGGGSVWLFSASKRCRRVPAVAGFLAGGLCFPSLAQTTYQWSNTLGGTFGDSQHWSPSGGPPGPLDTARFAADGNYVVTLNGMVSNDQLEFDAAHVTFHLNGFTYNLTGFYPCATFAGQQSFAGGALNTVWGVIDGMLTFDGPSTSWTNVEGIYLGVSDPAEVEVRGGADVSAFWTSIAAERGSSGSLVLRDPGSTWTCFPEGMVVGTLGQGDLTLTLGATLNCVDAEVGGNLGGVGVATVSEGGQWLIPDGETIIGSSGDGTLTIKDDGLVSSGFWSSIGESQFGSGEVYVQDVGAASSAVWDIANYVAIGEDGPGLIKVESATQADDARVNVGNNFYIGYDTGGDGEVQIIGPGSTLLSTNGTVGQAGVGHLIIRDGGLASVEESLVLADEITSTGTVLVEELVTSNTPTVVATEEVVVASRGLGTFELINRGHLITDVTIVGESEDATGVMTVTGSNAVATIGTLLTVGSKGQGTLNINGGVVSVPTVTAGTFVAGNGTINMVGGQLNAGVGALTIGYEGTGTLNASGGAVITCPATPDGLVVAAKPGSYGTVNLSGTGTLIDVIRQFAMERDGLVTITDNAVLKCRKGVSPTSSAGIIGTNEPSVAELHVQSNGLLDCVDGFLQVGFRLNTDGTLVVSEGGKVTSVGGFIGRFLGATGRATVTGADSHWTNTATLTIGVEGTGKLTVNDAGLVAAPSTIIGPNGTLEGIDGLVDSPVVNGGRVGPGTGGTPATPGVLNVDGNYQQSAAGKLRVVLGGSTPGIGHSQLSVNGNIALNGTLEVVLADGYSPPPGATYEVVLGCAGGACAVTGTFSQVIPADTYTVTYNADSVVITAPGKAEPCLADIAGEKSGGDGEVNVDDLLAVISNWGPCVLPPPPASNCPADLTGDGLVGVDDLLSVISAWGLCP